MSSALLALPRTLDSQGPENPEPIAEPHFPSRLYQFVWRNWELANTVRLAQVLQTHPRNVLDLGSSMGLPRKPELTADQLRRVYVTVIRQNWHSLPDNQIIELLGWTRDKFYFTLKEDDFLNVKLGQKPHCTKLVYHAPTRREKEQAIHIRNVIRQVLGAALDERGEQLFQFVQELSDPVYRPLRDRSMAPTENDVDLTTGWAIVRPANNEVLVQAVERLGEYLDGTMGVHLGSSSHKNIHIEIDPVSGSSPEDFEVRVSNSEIRLVGRGEVGALGAIHRFQDRMEQRGGPFLKKGTEHRRQIWTPRYLYSYFALYGDPLMESDIDPFPDVYLERLARSGINGVWIQAVLNTLAPSRHFPEFGTGWETRLRNLSGLVKRARQFGIKVYFYLNEPRAMPLSFFDRHPEIKGSSHLNLYSMCTSVSVVREWIADALAHIAEHVPDLGGFFAITMSENHTNCFSHGGTWGKGAPSAADCPRCSQRKSWGVIAELIATFRDGVRRHGSAADVIAWDWGWGDALADQLIPLLPRDVKLLSVSEWEQPVKHGRTETSVGEYSISVVGPGPRALRNWERAAKHRITTMAKVQFNNSWEMAAVPYIPVLHLVLQHCENLMRAGISGIMAAWTCGGFPSPNLAAAKAYYFEPRPSKDEILAAVAAQRYGDRATPEVIESWKKFSEAFEEFPYGVAIYLIPTQHGPANPLRFRSTGYRATMTLFPYDDFKRWSGAYSPEVVHEQFTLMAAKWQEGLQSFHRGLRHVPVVKRHHAELDLSIAETCYHHFRSVANQLEFYLLREQLHQPDTNRDGILGRMRELAELEIELAKRQYTIARRHSVIAYEASDHYFYTPLDLVEKILNCRHILDHELASTNSQKPP